MEIQGTEAQIDSVILAIEAGRFLRIDNMSSELIPLLEDEKGFQTH
jgi:acylphosphatase